MSTFTISIIVLVILACLFVCALAFYKKSSKTRASKVVLTLASILLAAGISFACYQAFTPSEYQDADTASNVEYTENIGQEESARTTEIYVRLQDGTTQEQIDAAMAEAENIDGVDAVFYSEPTRSDSEAYTTTDADGDETVSAYQFKNGSIVCWVSDPSKVSSIASAIRNNAMLNALFDSTIAPEQVIEITEIEDDSDAANNAANQ